MAARSALVSAGRLLDPFVEAIAPVAASSGGGPLASLNAWRRQRRSQATHNRAMYELSSRVEKGFRADVFLARAAADYKAILDALSAGQWAAVAPLVTPECLVSIRRGAEAGIAETGFLQGASVVEAAEPPAIVQARVGFLNGELGRGVMEAPDVAQLTVRLTTLQAGRAAPAGGGAAKTRPAVDEAAALGEWVAVEDPASGHVYYANPATGAATWVKPGPKQWATGRAPFRVESAGASRALVTDHPACGAGGQPLVRVVHHVTWERVVRGGAPPVWRVAKM